MNGRKLQGRYLIFAFGSFPGGGWRDFYGAADTLDEAYTDLEFLFENKTLTRAEIVDTGEGRIVSTMQNVVSLGLITLTRLKARRRGITVIK